MTGQWWERDSAPPVPALPAAPWPALPDLVAADARAIMATIAQRRPGFTPDWTPAEADDPGVVLSHAFAAAASLVASQVNRRPEAMARQLAFLAGVGPGSAVPAASIVTIGIDPAAPSAVGMGDRTVLLGPTRPDGLPTVFETVRALTVVPATIEAVALQVGTAVRVLDAATLNAPFNALVFGTTPMPGSRIWFGFSPGVATGSLTLHVGLSADVAPSSDRNAVEWSALAAGAEVPLTVRIDETSGFTRSGIVELGLPDGWGPEVHPSPFGPIGAYRWVTARLTAGGFEQPPRLTACHLNAVRVEGLETIGRQPIEPDLDPTRPEGRPTYRLGQTPVIAGTVQLEIDSGVTTDPFGLEASAASSATWVEVPSLAGHQLDEHVFSVDAQSGELRFPDPDRGAFRRVTALSYRVSGGIATFPAGTTLTLRDNLPSLTSATAIEAGGGGSDTEAVADSLVRFPARLRSAGRAVLPADYEIEALAAPGAGVARALAVPGRDGDNRPRPGWVRLVVVSTWPDPTGRPVPTRSALDRLEQHLTAHLAPIGVTVAAVPARFMIVRVEARVVVDAGRDPAVLLGLVTDAIDGLLTPFDSAAGPGFPFGAPVSHRAVMAAVGSLEGVIEADVRLMADGRLLPACADAVLPAEALPLAGPHLVTILAEGARP